MRKHTKTPAPSSAFSSPYKVAKENRWKERERASRKEKERHSRRSTRKGRNEFA